MKVTLSNTQSAALIDSTAIEALNGRAKVDGFMGSNVEIEDKSGKIAAVRVCSNEGCSLNCTSPVEIDESGNAELKGLESGRDKYICALIKGSG